MVEIPVSHAVFTSSGFHGVGLPLVQELGDLRSSLNSEVEQLRVVSFC